MEALDPYPRVPGELGAAVPEQPVDLVPLLGPAERMQRLGNRAEAFEYASGRAVADAQCVLAPFNRQHVLEADRSTSWYR